jgi:biotin carboxyl carrier protein
MSNVSGVQQARDRVLQMARQIEDLAHSAAPPEIFFPEFIRLLVLSLGARAGAVWMLEGGSRLLLNCDVRYAETGIRENPQAARANDRILTETMTTGQAACFAPDDPSAGPLPVNFLVVVAALQIGEDCVGAVEIFQRPDAPTEARPGYLQFVEQMTGHASRYLERRQSESGDDATRFLADFEQFLLQLQRGENVRDVAVTAANDGRHLLGCDRLSVAIHKGKKTSMAAISGQDRVNGRANLTRAMARLAGQVIAMREPLSFSGRVEHLPPQVEKPLADFIQESGSRMVKLLPLFEPEPLVDREESGGRRSVPKKPLEVIGCLVVEQTSDSRPHPKLEARAEMLAEHVGSVLSHARRQDRILFLRTWQKLGRGLEWFHGRKLAKTLAAAAVLAVVAGVLTFVPWEYRVVGKGKLMPIKREQVFAPENGDVVEILVKGGEHVAKDAPLVVLRNEQLSAELTDARSKLRQSAQAMTSYADQAQQASKEGDRASRLRAEAGRAKSALEVAGLTRTVEILQQRVDALRVKSHLEGTVASFQLEQLLRGRPVQQGELLLEIMDETGPWRLELEIESSRMGHVLRAWNDAPDHTLPVEFIPATAAESTFHGELNEIASRSAISSEEGNVFEAYVSTDASNIPNLRIGAEVRAKISCGTRALGYVLFGDVIEFIRQRLWL